MGARTACRDATVGACARPDDRPAVTALLAAVTGAMAVRLRAVSFGRDARTVRDASAPLHRRVVAWRRCVHRYAPYGFGPTALHLQERFGSLNDPAALASAMSALEASRRVWLVEVAQFRLRRRAAKAQGRRRANASELAPYRQQGWPGGEAAGGPRPGSVSDRPVTHEFLAACGMTLWAPAPVNHRRRVRRLPAVDSAYGTFFGLLGCGGFGLALIALAGWAIADPPVIAWWTFTVTGALTLVVLAWREVSGGAAHRHESLLERGRIMAMADAAEQRWKADRKRSFNLR